MHFPLLSSLVEPGFSPSRHLTAVSGMYRNFFLILLLQGFERRHWARVATSLSLLAFGSWKLAGITVRPALWSCEARPAPPLPPLTLESILPHAGMQELEKSLLIFSDPTFINTKVNLSAPIYLILLHNAHLKKISGRKDLLIRLFSTPNRA